MGINTPLFLLQHKSHALGGAVGVVGTMVALEVKMRQVRKTKRQGILNQPSIPHHRLANRPNNHQNLLPTILNPIPQNPHKYTQ